MIWLGFARLYGTWVALGILLSCERSGGGTSPAPVAPTPPPTPAFAASAPTTAEAGVERARTLYLPEVRELASAPVPSRSSRRYAVAALGDSLTDPRSGGGGYLEGLRRACPKSRFDGYGIGGQMVNQMRRRLAPIIAGGRYTHLLVFGGVNDLYSDLTAGRVPEEIEVDLTAIYSRAHAAGLKVVGLTVSPWGGFARYYNARRAAATRELNGWMRQQQQAGVLDHLLETGPLLSCGSPELLCATLASPFTDGIHFGPQGHERLSEALHRTIFDDCE